jgi:hypothetical protein
VRAARSVPGGAAGAAALVLGAIALALAGDAGVKVGRALEAVPDLARAAVAALALFALTGHAIAVRLAPDGLRDVRHLLVLPVGAMVASLALTVLGFARVPLEASLAAVMLGGAIASGLALRVGLERAPVDRRWLAVGAAIGVVVACLATVPSWRAGIATVPGVNPDAHLVTGVALLLQEEPPTGGRLGLPVAEVPEVWKSKYPIFYALAGVAELSGLDPIKAFPAVAALLAAFVALGFGLVTARVLRAAPAAGALAAAAIGLSPVLLHLPLHPYWNQLWGLATFPLALLFAWYAVAHRDARATVLFALTLALGAFAYPLMLPYPLAAFAGFALALRRVPPLPSWARGRWAVAGALVGAALVVPLLGVGEKVRDAAGNLLGGEDGLWMGDVLEFVDVGWFFGVGGGALGAVAVGAFALLGLVKAVPRAPALALATLLALSALADLRLRLDDTGAYYDYKHLSFVGPIAICLAVAGVAWLAGRRRPAPVALAAVAVAAWTGATAWQTRDEVRGTLEQVPERMLALRGWSRDLPPGASVRLDVAPSGFQLWAAYFLSEHPLNSPTPVVYTTYPHVASGTRADYSLALAPPVARRLAGAGSPPPPVPPGAAPRPVRANALYVLRRIVRPRGSRTASRARF